MPSFFMVCQISPSNNLFCVYEYKAANNWFSLFLPQQFMVWRLPDREIGVPPEPEGLELPPEYITRNSGVCVHAYVHVQLRMQLLLEVKHISDASAIASHYIANYPQL